MSVVKVKTSTENPKPPRPTKAAIAALKDDPSLAPAFDEKYGAGSAARYLQQTVDLTEMMGELLEQQAELIAKIEELVDVMKAPRQVFRDADGEVAGAVPMTNIGWTRIRWNGDARNAKKPTMRARVPIETITS